MYYLLFAIVFVITVINMLLDIIISFIIIHWGNVDAKYLTWGDAGLCVPIEPKVVHLVLHNSYTGNLLNGSLVLGI